MRFIRGHVGQLRKRELLTPDLWAEEDRGFTTSCWIWRGRPHSRTGYCRVKYQGRFQLPHRALYEQEVGPIPDGYDIDHLCSQRACVNPAHLEAVTRAENIRRSRTAKLTAADVALIRASSLSERKLALVYGVARQTIGGIRRGEIW